MKFYTHSFLPTFMENFYFRTFILQNDIKKNYEDTGVRLEIRFLYFCLFWIPSALPAFVEITGI